MTGEPAGGTPCLEALVFDVFGTCVDWREGVAAAVREAGLAVDPHVFADHWRGLYQPSMERVRSQGRAYVDLEVLHRENLHESLACHGLTVEPGAAERLNDAWQRLPPWPDTVPGLHAMRGAGFRLAPCSNGSIATMRALARHANLPWDAIGGAGVARDYKPRPTVYEKTCALLALPPERVMMVAAHNDDLLAARLCGLRTGFVARPREHGPDQTTDLAPTERWDVVADSMEDLARQLTGQR